MLRAAKLVLVSRKSSNTNCISSLLICWPEFTLPIIELYLLGTICVVGKFVWELIPVVPCIITLHYS